MILEHAVIDVVPGQEAAFEAAVAQAGPLFAAHAGFVDARLERCVEQPASYLLLVRWRSLEDHTVGFRGSPEFRAWRELVGPYFAAPPVVLHYATAATLSGDPR